MNVQTAESWYNLKKLLTILITMIIAAPAYANGIGIKVTKYNCVKMPIYITDVLANSPASKNNLTGDTFIESINNKSTIKLSLEECLNLLNTDEKQVTLKLRNITSKKAYKVKIDKSKDFKDSIGEIYLKENQDFYQTRLFVYLMYNNKLPDILQLCFKGLNRNDNPEMWQAFDNDYNLVVSEYQQFKKSPNNMKTNYELVQTATQLNSVYLEIMNNRTDAIFTIIKNYCNRRYMTTFAFDGSNLSKIISPSVRYYYPKSNYNFTELEEIRNNYYKETHNITTKELYDFYIVPSKVSNVNDFVSFFKTLSEYAEECNRIASEVYKYSAGYEAKNLSKSKKTAGFIPDGNILSVLLGYKTPTKNAVYFYAAKPVPRLEVTQNVAAGLLIRPRSEAIYYSYAGRPKTIFVTTNKKFADDELIQNDMYFIYQGHYSYVNTLGARNTVYKFKEISKNEYNGYLNKSYKGLYFINPETN